MKVDFLASYNELSKALAHHRRSTPSTESKEFRQHIDNIDKNTINKQSGTTQLAPAAADSTSPLYRLGSVGLDLIPPRSNEPMPTPSVNEPPPGVKTPRIVRIERQQGQPQPELAREIVQRLAPAVGIDPALGLAVAKAESSYNPLAVSSDGHQSKGLFQILDSTAKTVVNREGLDIDFDPFNPEHSADVGLRYLRYLHEVFAVPTAISEGLSTTAAANSTSLEKLAVAAYNAGEGRVAAAQVRARLQGKDPSEFEQIRPYLPEITQRYVDRVQRFRSENEAASIGSQSS